MQKIGIITLGCKVNQYESHAISEAFSRAGFDVTLHEEKCDAYIINTCTVTAESDRKGRQVIRRLLQKNPLAIVAVTGCLAQTNSTMIANIPGVDYICGSRQKMTVVEKVISLLNTGKVSKPENAVLPLENLGFEQMQISDFDRTRAYIKIEDGCESKCAYCTIPMARGKICSKCPEEVLNEVQELTLHGCHEVVLTGIETASYGKDIKNVTLFELLEKIDKIPNIGRVRLGSLDPSSITDEFIEHTAVLHSFAPHFHLSLQSGCDRTLGAMRRKYNTKKVENVMTSLRKAIKGVQFTTDVIVGFPGENEEDFEKTLQFCKEQKFLKIHIFPYSRRKGTIADTMKDQVEESVKHERLLRLEKVEKESRKQILDEYIGKTVEVLFETDHEGTSLGHTSNFLEVRVDSKKALHGSIHLVNIQGNDGEVCFGQIVEV